MRRMLISIIISIAIATIGQAIAFPAEELQPVHNTDLMQMLYEAGYLDTPMISELPDLSALYLQIENIKDQIEETKENYFNSLLSMEVAERKGLVQATVASEELTQLELKITELEGNLTNLEMNANEGWEQWIDFSETNLEEKALKTSSCTSYAKIKIINLSGNVSPNKKDDDIYLTVTNWNNPVYGCAKLRQDESPTHSEFLTKKNLGRCEAAIGKVIIISYSSVISRSTTLEFHIFFEVGDQIIEFVRSEEIEVGENTFQPYCLIADYTVR